MSDDAPDIPDEHRSDDWGTSKSPQEVIDDGELCAEGTVYAHKPFNVDPWPKVAKMSAPSPVDENSPDHDTDSHPDD